MAQLYRRGLGRAHAVRSSLQQDFQHSEFLDLARGEGLSSGGLRIRVAGKFGFCYGVERALDYAYQARLAFPQERLYLAGEMVHNPQVNRRLEELGVTILSGVDEPRLAAIAPGDVVLVPAFGLPRAEMEFLSRRGCVVVDTTCGSVLLVWKEVAKNARDGFTTVLHGKYGHAETRATRSRIVAEGGHYVVVLDKLEAELLAGVLEGTSPWNTVGSRLGMHASPGFDPAVHLEALGCAHQTTMLEVESRAIAARLRGAMCSRFGEQQLGQRFRDPGTVCTATQERQDALRQLLDEEPDLVLVVGGYDSSNTGHLTEIASEAGVTYHVEGAADLLSRRAIRHLPPGCSEEVVTWRWLAGVRSIGVTAGASTPPAEVERVLSRLSALSSAG